MVPVEPRFWLGFAVGMHLPEEGSKAMAEARVFRGKLQGTLRSPDGSPVVGASLALSGTSGGRTTSDAQGRFAINQVDPGKWQLSITAEGYDSATRDVDVEADATATVEIELMPTSLPLIGRIRAPDDSAIVGAAVTVVSGEVTLTAKTGADGAFSVVGVPLGPARMTVVAEGWGTLSQDVNLDPTVPVELDLRLKRPLPEGQIRGTVRAFNGPPLVATIIVQPLGTKLKSQSDGSFELDVAPGQYTIQVRAPGYRSQERPAVVEENGVTVILIDLRSKR